MSKKEEQIEALKRRLAYEYQDALLRASWSAAPRYETFERLAALVGRAEANTLLEAILEEVNRTFYLGK